MNNYTHGYDPFSHSWIVGIETSPGQIASALEFFPDKESAKHKADELNRKVNQ